MKPFRQHIEYLFFLVLPAVCILLYNSAINVHSHQLNGKIITHAHPYTKSNQSSSPFEEHKHSTVELFLLNKVFHLFSTIVIALIAFQILLTYKNKSSIIFEIFSIKESILLSKVPRGPPLFF